MHSDRELNFAFFFYTSVYTRSCTFSLKKARKNEMPMVQKVEVHVFYVLEVHILMIAKFKDAASQTSHAYPHQLS